MSDWPQRRIGELGKVVTGRTPPTRAPEYFGDDYLFITPTDLDERRYVDSTERGISATGAEAMPAQRIPSGSIMVSCIGWQLGKVAIAGRDAFTNQQINTIIPHPSVDRRFLYYHLRTRREEIRQLASGGTRTPILNKSRFMNLKIGLPTPGIQARIARTLGVLDDLIENNRRRVELLEQMAEAIYREWFVHFRYPDHEGVAMVKSPIGSVPEGWEVTDCGAVLSVQGGGTPSKDEPAYWEGGTIPWYTPSDLTRTRTRHSADPKLFITNLGLTKSSARLFPVGSVMMTSRATIGVLAIASTEAACNQGFIVVLPKDGLPPTFIYEWISAHTPELESLGTGATFKEVTKTTFKKVPFLLPPMTVIDEFGRVTEPIEALVRNLESEVRCLGKLRDLLLPKLVTGQIEVSDLDLDALVENTG